MTPPLRALTLSLINGELARIWGLAEKLYNSFSSILFQGNRLSKKKTQQKGR